MVAAARSVTAIIEEIRQRSDHENSDFVTDAELESWIGQSAADLHDLVIDHAGPEAFQASQTIPTVAGTDVYSLSGDFYRLIGVDVQFGSRWEAIHPYMPHERNRFDGFNGWTSPRDVRYALAGRLSSGVVQIQFIPTPQAVYQTRIWYVPLAYDTVIPYSAVTFNGWDEYIISDVCAKVLEKKEGDARPFLARRDRAEKRIISAATRLDTGGLRTMRDVSADDYDPDAYFRRS